MLSGRDFIVFSDDWGRHPFSCQHIMRHFLPHNRLLWVHTIGLRRPRLCWYDIKRAAEKICSWVLPRPRAENGEPPPDNLHILSPVMLPFNTVPGIRAVNRTSVVRAVRRAARGLGMRSPVLLATVPNAADYVGHLGEELVVYYCVDDFTVWPGMNQPALVRELENALLARSDLVVAVSDSLRVSRRNGRAPTRLLTHGVDSEHFDRSGARPPVPPALYGLCGRGRPLIGFYGLIDSHFDVGLLAGVLDARPGWHILCIGTRRINLSELERRPNFTWLPAMPYAELPLAAAQFDAAIIPYLVNAHTRTANPLKLREYIATGRPVITTPMPEVFRFEGCVRIADGPEAFVAAIEDALLAGVPPEGCRDLLRGETWADKAELLSGWIGDRLAEKSAYREAAA